MAQIKKKFIGDNQVADEKIRLDNNAYLRARNAANSADIDIIKVDGSDLLQFAFVPYVSADPSADNQLARKSYVDAVASGLDVKKSVRLASTAALPANTAAGSGVGKTLTGDANGALSVDGVAVAANDRILVKDETPGSDNGIYTVTQVGDAGNPYILTRATDADTNTEMNAGMFVFVEEGSTNADSGWVLTTNNPITVDTTALSFSQFSGAGSITAGAGLTKTGNTIDVVAANNSITVNADSIEVKFDPAGAVDIDGGGAGIEVNVDGTSIEISSNALRVASGAAGDGLGYSAGVLSVNVADGIQIVTDTVKAKVHSGTLKINASQEIEGLKPKKENFTLGASDITNQYIDLTQVAIADSIDFVVDGVIQAEGSDYTVNLTGGAGGKTRITFAGDLATGGAAALVSGDIVRIKYMYL